jgi:hypothetical protein
MTLRVSCLNMMACEVTKPHGRSTLQQGLMMVVTATGGTGEAKLAREARRSMESLFNPLPPNLGG